MISMSALDRIALPRRTRQEKSLPVSPPLPTVFVLHSDALVGSALMAAIEGSGWQARLFLSAEEFLASSPAPGASCLVLDVTMLGLAHLDLRGRVGNGGRSMPVILASRCGKLVMTVSAVQEGSVELVKTPTGQNPILAAVGYAIERSRAVLEQQAETKRLKLGFPRSASESARFWHWWSRAS